MIIKKTDIWAGTIFIWLMLFMAVPEALGIYKYISLLMVILAIFLEKKIKVRLEDIKWFMILELLFCFCLINSHINGFKNDSVLYEVYLVRPFIYIILTTISINHVKLKKIVQIILIITLVSELYNVLYFAQTIGIIPQIIKFDNSLSIIDSSFLTFRIENQTGMCFTIPLVIYLYKRKKDVNINGVLVNIVFWLGLIVSILSGRRILQVLVVLFLSIIFRPRLSSKTKRRTMIRGMEVVITLLVLAIGIINRLNEEFGFNFVHSIISTLTNIFDKFDYSSLVRTRQIETLLKDWMKKPIFGWGLAAYNTDYINYRASVFGVMPTKNLWSYEYFYIALLYQTGIVGVGILMALVFKILRKISKYLKKVEDSEDTIYIRAFSYGIIAFLIAGFTNPMITSIWYWFLVLNIYHFVCENTTNL